MADNPYINTSDFSGLTFDENNALDNTDFIPAFDFDEFEPADFDLSTSKLPEFKPPDFGFDEPIFEYEPPQLDLEDPIFEYEPPKLNFQDPDFELDDFEPLVVPETNSSSIFEPSDRLSLPTVTTNSRPTFRNLPVSKNRRGGAGNDSLTGNSFANTIEGLGGDDILNGGGGSDRLIGGKGNDLLTGGTGNDVLIGVNPYDLFAGRGEYDGLVGGTGGDTFILGDRSGAYYLGSGSATIWDFNAFAGDSIQLTGSASQYSLEANNFGNTNIFRGTDLIAVVYDTDLISSISLDFV